MSEIETMLNMIASHEGVKTVVVFNKRGEPVHHPDIPGVRGSTLKEHIGIIDVLTNKARSLVRDIDPQSDLTFLRIKSRRDEILIAPGKEFTMFVIQNPTDTEIPSHHQTA